MKIIPVSTMYNEILLAQEASLNFIGNTLNKIKAKNDIIKTFPKVFDNLYFEYTDEIKSNFKIYFCNLNFLVKYINGTKAKNGNGEGVEAKRYSLVSKFISNAVSPAVGTPPAAAIKLISEKLGTKFCPSLKSTLSVFLINLIAA